MISFGPVLTATLPMRVGFYNNLLLILLAFLFAPQRGLVWDFASRRRTA